MSLGEEGFFRPEEQALADRFLAEGYVAVAVADRSALDRIRAKVAGLAADFLGLTVGEEDAFLNTIHHHVTPENLNALRLHVFEGINAEPWFRPAYFRLARAALEVLAGNELCMQRRVNLSIQLPRDQSSLLAAHADSWSGDSPFEVVVWLPLVDVWATKSMYLAAPEASACVAERLASFRNPEAVFEALKSELRWLEVPYGQVVVFNQTLVHGNRVNAEDESRWTMNCRFKSLFSPYADKKLGEFFEPVTLRAASRIGLDYRLPGGFDD